MRRQFTLTSCTILSILLCGCAHSIQFSVIDAETREPLHHVQTEQGTITPGFLKDFDYTNKGISNSGASNLIEIEGLSRRGNHAFLFSATDYHTACFVLSHGEGWLLSPYPTNAVESNYLPLADPVVIPMYRDASSTERQLKSDN